jgi:hypothetical protein
MGLAYILGDFFHKLIGPPCRNPNQLFLLSNKEALGVKKDVFSRRKAMRSYKLWTNPAVSLMLKCFQTFFVKISF